MYVEPYQVVSTVIMNKTYARIGLPKVDLFCQSVKPGVFRTKE